MSRPIIDVRNVSKRYQLGAIGATSLKEEVSRWWERLRQPSTVSPPGADEFWALRDISFSLQPGEVVGVIGRNGAGKSTLLKILSRITEQTTGEITLRGRVASLLEVGTGFHPDLTGRENVFLNGAILGMTRLEIKRKFDEIVAFAEVDRFIDTPVKRYSSGMYVRLAFAVAAHLEPEILIVDEVLAVGDAAFQQKCLGKMGDVANREGRTVLFVSHNMAAVSQLCQRSVLLDAGRLALDAPTAETISKYLAAAYSEVGERDFAVDPAKRVQICRVEVVQNQSGPSTVFELAQAIETVIDFRVTDTVAGASIGWMIEKPDGTPVCHSNSRDQLGAMDRTVWTPGNYRATVTFPGGLLNVGDYTLRIGIALIGAHTELFDHQECFMIRIRDSAGANAGVRPRPGVLLIQLPWRTARLESDALSTPLPAAGDDAGSPGVPDAAATALTSRLH